MKHFINKLIIYSLITFSFSTQAYSKGASRPVTGQSSTTVSRIQNALPLIETLLPLFGGVSPLLGSVLPIIGNVIPLLGNFSTQTQSSGLGNLLSRVGTLTSRFRPLASTVPEINSPIVSGGPYIDQIKELAEISSCANHTWKDGSIAPSGYVKGVALSYARSACRLKKAQKMPSTLASILGRAISLSNTKDALSIYQNIFGNLINVNAGEAPLRAVYVLGMGLGMKQSSGLTCGSSATGVFQTSYASLGISSVLSKLYTEYKSTDSSRCFLDVFNEGTSCVSSSNSSAGQVLDYKAFNKSCPAFATEMAMTLLRLNRSTFEAINTKQVEVVPACDELLLNVQELIDQDTENVCRDIF